MKLNFYQQGNLGATPVILIHGLFGSLSNLSGLGRALAESYCVYQPDLRNHGASEHSDQMSFDCMAADIIELMDDQNLTTVAIIGHSLGGKVAMQLMLNYPDRISKLVVIDIAPVKYEPRHEAIFAGLNELNNTFINTRKGATLILEKHIDEADIRAFLLKNLLRTKSGEYILKLNLKSIQAQYKQLSAAIYGGVSQKPVLFIKGGQSNYLMMSHKNIILKLFPNASFKIIANAGHWLHVEKPIIFNKLVINFLA